jgi:hypothetical protein
MINLLQIMEGWRNKLVPPEELRDIIAAATKERLAICRECPFHSSKLNTMRLDEHCAHCGCTLSAKTACLTCMCPTAKWGPIDAK